MNATATDLTAFALSAVVAVVTTSGAATPPAGRLRSRIGAASVAVATLVPLAIVLCVCRRDLGALAAWADRGRLLVLLGGAVLVLGVGLVGDVRPGVARYKLVALVVAGLGLCAAGGAVQRLTVNGRVWLDLDVLAWPVTLAWLVGVAVGIQFIDGLGGLAAGVAAAGAGVLAVGAAAAGNGAGVVLGLCLAGSLVGFLARRRFTAGGRLGGGGSLFAGYLLAGAGVLGDPWEGTTRAVLLPALALVVPGLDTFFTLVRRRVERRSLFAAEDGHIHDRLLTLGLRPVHAVLALYAVTAVASGVAVVCVAGAPWAAAGSAVVLVAVVVGLLRVADTVRARATVAGLRRNRAIAGEVRRYRHAFYDAQLHLREARSVEDWWAGLCRAADGLDFGRLDLTLSRRDGTADVRQWRRDRADGPAGAGGDAGATAAATDGAEAGADSIVADVPVPQRRAGTPVRAQVEVLASTFLETGGERVAMFSRLMSEFGLDRLPRPPGRGEPLAGVGDARSGGDG